MIMTSDRLFGAFDASHNESRTLFWDLVPEVHINERSGIDQVEVSINVAKTFTIITKIRKDGGVREILEAVSSKWMGDGVLGLS